jgi:glucose-1-phosphatase
MPKIISTVIFDLGNVILFFNHMIFCNKFSKISGFKPDEIYIKIFKSNLGKKYDNGEIESVAFYEEICKIFRVDITFEEFRKIWCEIFWLNHEIIDILDSIKNKTKIILLSNTNEMHFSYVKEKFEILNRMDNFVLSYKIGFSKPDIRIFQYALNSNNLNPEKTIYIDDISDFTAIANNLGINGITFYSSAYLKNEFTKYKFNIID